MLDTARHRTILLRLLKDIFKDPLLGPALGFKGGTAAMLFHDLGRFSTDLDFDLLDLDKAEAVRARLHEIAAAYGDIKQSRERDHAIFLMLSYGSSDHNVKIEVSTCGFGSRYEPLNYLGIPMRVMVREDMFAHKLVAMTERLGKSNRDIYDVWFFASQAWPVSRAIVAKRTGLTLEKFLAKAAVSLEKLPQQGMLHGLGELLDSKQKEWVKKNLKEEALFLLRLMEDNERRR